MSDQLMGHQEGDALSSKHRKSAQEELAEFQLLKEKMLIRSDARATPIMRNVLGAMSEIEVLTLSIAEKISTDEKYEQSNPHYTELSQLSGETSYIGMARYLATKIYEQKRGQKLIAEFSGDASVGEWFSSNVGKAKRGGLFGAVESAVEALTGGGGKSA
jgi:hypothetical protein